MDSRHKRSSARGVVAASRCSYARQIRRVVEPRRAPRRSAFAAGCACLESRVFISLCSVVLALLLKRRRHGPPRPHCRLRVPNAPPPFLQGRFPLASHPCGSRVVAVASMPPLCSNSPRARPLGKHSCLRQQRPKICPWFRGGRDTLERPTQPPPRQRERAKKARSRRGKENRPSRRCEPQANRGLDRFEQPPPVLRSRWLCLGISFVVESGTIWRG